MRSIAASTRAFEAWMGQRADISKRLLEKKHRKMSLGPLPFLRATFYRWVEQWPKICPALAARDVDVLLAVGDLHVENFGIWHNSFGQLVWGVNDFDEACEVPFTSDLVRLAVSVALAVEEQQAGTSAQRFCRCLLNGYRAALAKNGGELLVRDFETLRTLARDTAEDRATFWAKKLSRKEFKPCEPPASLRAMFRASFPRGASLTFGEQRDPGGLGSLGRRRYTALLMGRGKMPADAREAKALVPSAFYWIANEPDMRSQTATVLQHAIRSPDPSFQVHDRWLIRQLAPDVAKIELPTSRSGRLHLVADVLEFMGWETANIHLGSRTPQYLQARLEEVERIAGKRWLEEAAERMAASVRDDHREWARDWKKRRAGT